MSSPRWRRGAVYAPGIVPAVTVAAVAMAVHERLDAVSPHIIAVLLGILGANLGRIDAVLRPGLRFSAKHVLRAGIVLLGFRLSLDELGQLGPRALVAVIVVVVATFFGTQLIGRWMGLSPGMSLLMATGYSICGASAIAAMEPFADAGEEDVAYSLAMVTLCGSLSIGVLPLLGHALGLSDARFGAWVGAAVHDVGQVVAAASTRSAEAIRRATLVKLTRVALLAPMLALTALHHRRRGAPVTASKRPPPLPLFVVLFLVAVAVRSAAGLSPLTLARLKNVETFLLAMGLFGLGTGVDVRKLRAVGRRPLVLGLVSWALVAAVSLAAVTLAE